MGKMTCYVIMYCRVTLQQEYKYGFLCVYTEKTQIQLVLGIVGPHVAIVQLRNVARDCLLASMDFFDNRGSFIVISSEKMFIFFNAHGHR